MSMKSIIEELRHKKQCVERAIRALERVQQAEQADPIRREATSNVIVLPQASDD